MKNFWPLPKDRADVLAVSALLGTTLFFFTPALLYFLNVSQFVLSFIDVAPWLALSAAFFAAAAAGLFMTLPPGARSVALAAGAGMALALWLQANVLVWDYGVLDGQPIQWARHDGKTFLELTAWLSVVAAAVFFRSLVVRHLKAICLFLFLVQAASLGVAAIRAPRYEIKRWQLDETDKFAFSSSKNVIILVLDSFQSTHFQDVLGGDAGAARFDGFIYFRNATSGYNRTYASVPNLLTGMYYDNSVPFQEFVRKAYLSEGSLPKAVRRAGGAVHLFPESLTRIHPDPALVSNLKPRTPGGWKYRADAMNLMALGLFRQSPHSAKKLLFGSINKPTGTWWTPELMHSGKYVKSDLAFFDKFDRDARVKLQGTVLKYYHLYGVHRPFYLTRGMKFQRGMPQNEQGYREQAAGDIALVHRFLEKLKQIGVYDQSMILILADHGAAMPVRVPAGLPGSEKTRAGKTPGDWLNFRGEALPLVLVKPFNAHWPLKLSDSPVCLADVPVTIAGELGLKGRFAGYSMRGAVSPERPRRFLHYIWKRLDFDAAYLPQLEEFTVTGHAWLENSWNATGRVYPPGQKKT